MYENTRILLLNPNRMNLSNNIQINMLLQAFEIKKIDIIMFNNKYKMDTKESWQNRKRFQIKESWSKDNRMW